MKKNKDKKKIVTICNTSSQATIEGLSFMEICQTDCRPTIRPFDFYMIPLTAWYLYLYYLEANHFCPLVIHVSLNSFIT